MSGGGEVSEWERVESQDVVSEACCHDQHWEEERQRTVEVDRQPPERD